MKNIIRHFLYDYLGTILACKVDLRKKFLENGLRGSYFFFSYGGCATNYIRKIYKKFWYEDFLQSLDFTKDGPERQRAVATGWKYHMDIATGKKTFQNVKANALFTEKREWLPLFMFKEYIPTQNILDTSLDALMMSSVHNPKCPHIARNFTFIYIIGNPYLSFLSIFRRRLFHPTFELLTRLNGQRIDPMIDLDTLLDKEEDVLGFEKNFDNWINAQLNPNHQQRILYIKADHLFEYMPLANIFINDQPEIREFKERTRTTSLDNLDPSIFAKLKKIYAPLKKKIDALPPFFIKSSISFTSPSLPTHHQAESICSQRLPDFEKHF